MKKAESDDLAFSLGCVASYVGNSSLARLSAKAATVPAATATRAVATTAATWVAATATAKAAAAIAAAVATTLVGHQVHTGAHRVRLTARCVVLGATGFAVTADGIGRQGVDA